MLRLAAIGSLLLALYPALAAVPSFTARQDIATGFTTLSSVAIADFNGDGKPDLAITGSGDKRLLVYLNNGKGGFLAPVVTLVTTDALGLGPLVAGDINNDGKQDVVIGPISGNQIDVTLLGKGDGTFTQGANVKGSYGILAGTLIDVNKDGNLDLIAGGNGSADVYLGDGKGGFTEQFINLGSGFNVTPVYLDIVTGDFNRDDKLDFFFSTYNPGELRFFAGGGDGTFKPPVDTTSKYLTPPDSLATADFNRDGILDLLVSSPNIVSLLRGNGDGSLRTGTADFQTIYIPDSTKFKNGDYAPRVATADLDGDGTPDILAADPYNNLLSMLLNDGKGSFLQNTPDVTAQLSGKPTEVLTADLNGDGLPDVIVTDTTNQNVSYFLSVRPKVAATATLTSSTSQVLAGGSVSLTANVTGTTPVAFATAKPTGTVSLLEGTQALAQATLDANGNATFSLPSLAAGTHTLTLNYAGDSNFLAGSTAGSVVIAITDVTPALPAASQTIAAGGTATYTLNLTPVASFSGTASFTCSGLPTGYSCSSTPVALAGQPATATVRVVGGSASLVPLTNPFGWRGRGAGIASAVLLLACCLPAGRRSRATLLLFAFAVVFAGALSGCSGGSNNTTTPTTPTPTTPTVPTYRGTTNFTITTTLTQGSQTVTHTTAATLVVQ